MALGAGAVLGDPLEFTAEGALLLRVGHVRELVLGEQAGLDTHCELDLFGRVQQGDLTDLLQVVLDRVCGGAGDGARVHRNFVFVVHEGQHEGAARKRCRRGGALGALLVGVFVVGIDVVGVVLAGNDDIDDILGARLGVFAGGRLGLGRGALARCRLLGGRLLRCRLLHGCGLRCGRRCRRRRSGGLVRRLSLCGGCHSNTSHALICAVRRSQATRCRVAFGHC